MRSLFFIAAGVTGLMAQTPVASPELTPETLLLSRIRLSMTQNLKRQPNYTCVETVERSRRPSATRKFSLYDTLRLEVALVDGKEMFGWPGAKKFQDTELSNIVTEGAIGNGNFALHARSIFESNSPSFQYRGETDLGGQPSVRYDFVVPRFMSGYKIRVAEKEAIVGYHGSFYADPKTLDIQRIEVIADDIPRTLGMSAASDRMDYGSLRIGEGEFLLPVASELVMIDLNGNESRNQVRFTGCRQFTGESVLSFGDPPPSDGPAPPAIEEIELPSQMGVTLSLMEELDIGVAAIGDPVKARLHNDLKHKGKLLFHKGATALGRITRLERHDDYTVLGLEFNALEQAKAHANLKLKLEYVAGGPLLSPSNRTPRLNPHPGEGIIPLRSGRLRVLRGILMFWRT